MVKEETKFRMEFFHHAIHFRRNEGGRGIFHDEYVEVEGNFAC